MTRAWRNGRRGTGLVFSGLPVVLDPLRLEQLATDFPSEEEHRDRHRDHEPAVDPDLRLVAPVEEQVEPVGSSREEDEKDPRAERRPEGGPTWRITWAVEHVVRRVIAGDAALEPWPGQQDEEHDQRKERPAPERVGDQCVV